VVKVALRKGARLTAVIAMLGFAITGKASTIYNISDTGAGGGIGLGEATVMGTLTTDGTIGALTSSNVLTWDLTVQCPVVMWCANSNFTLTGGPGGNSVLTLSGGGLSATVAQLSYTFEPAAYFEILNGGQGWGLGAVPAVGGGLWDVILGNTLGATMGPRSAGNVSVIGTTTTPEPSSIFLVPIAFLGLMISARIKSRTCDLN